MKQIVKIVMEKFIILKNWKINQEISDVKNYNDKMKSNQKKTDLFIELYYRISYISIDSVEVILVVVLSYFAIVEKANIADIWAIVLITGFMKNYIIEFAFIYREVLHSSLPVKRLIDICEDIPSIIWYDNWKDFEYFKWDISIKNVSFRYYEKFIFEDFSIDIKWWKNTAFVWKSWTWKTTLIKLILWFIRPQEWSIFVDNQNMIEFSLKSYYKYIWYLSQESSIFDWTIYENLIYGLPKSTSIKNNDIEKVLKLAECDFIDYFPDWFQTEVWEKWVRLSWWERQRLAIARLFLQDPKIIILDEPTSSLDSVSETKISKALKNLSKNKTVIIIAHRLQTVIDADEIIVLWKNKILERGSHKELSKSSNFYSKMLNLQSWIFKVNTQK